jgi:ribose 1,5-bisphosphokinase
VSGAWVFVCGPSGAGKDSVIAWARDRLAGHGDVVFSQRWLTRPTTAGADHQGIDPAHFARLRDSGGLAWHWEAHGFHYGVGARYARQVGWGRVVVVNGSREHVAGLHADSKLRVVQVVADPVEVAQRLSRRGREAPEGIASRLARNARLGPVGADLMISNDGALAVAGQRLAKYLVNLAAAADVPHAPIRPGSHASFARPSNSE